MTANALAEFSLNGKTWTLDPLSLTMNDTIILERFTGRAWLQILKDFDVGSATAIQAMWWAARRQSGEDVAFDDPSMNPPWRGFVSRWVEPADQPAHVAEPNPAVAGSVEPSAVPA